MLTRALTLLALSVAASALTGCCCLSGGGMSACYQPPAYGCNPCGPVSYGPPAAPVSYGGHCGCYGGSPGGCGYGYGGSGCCLWDLFMGIEQWKCDLFGCCMFGTRPRFGGGGCGPCASHCHNPCPQPCQPYCPQPCPQPCAQPIYTPACNPCAPTGGFSGYGVGYGMPPGYGFGGGCANGSCGTPAAYPPMMTAPGAMMQSTPGTYSAAPLSVPQMQYPAMQYQPMPANGQFVMPQGQ